MNKEKRVAWLSLYNQILDLSGVNCACDMTGKYAAGACCFGVTQLQLQFLNILYAMS